MDFKYLELAKYITDHSGDLPDTEAGLRSSVSRAYYSAFGTARKYISETDGQEYRGGDAHRKVRDHLKNTKDYDIKKMEMKRKIANQLEGIHMNRIKADYHDHIREKPRAMAIKTITKAKEIIEELHKLAESN